jgi:hypothetical protein
VLLQAGAVMEWNGTAAAISKPIDLPGDRRSSVAMERIRDARWVFASDGRVAILERGAWREGPKLPIDAPDIVVTSTLDGGRPMVLTSAGRLFVLDAGSWNEAASMSPPQTRETGPVALRLPWAFGHGGQIWKKEGAHWRAVRPTADVVDRTGVWGAAPNDVWITRADADVDRYDGKTWSRATTPLKAARAIAGTGVNDVWIGGESGIALWDGARFHHFDLGDTIVALAAIAPGDVWALAEAAAFHWNGHRWQRISVPATTRFASIVIAADGTPWITGMDTTWNEQPHFYAWDGTSFVRRNDGSPWPPRRVRALVRIPSGDALALWVEPRKTVLRRNVDGTWVDEDVPVESLYYKRHLALHAFASGETWIVGAGGIIVHRCAK